MTDPLHPYDVELLKRFDTELQEIASLPPAVIELPANQAQALVSIIQICATNRGLEHNPLMLSVIAAAKQIQSSFNPDSAIHEVLELGWQKSDESCAPHKIFTSVQKRQQKLRRPPPYYPDDDHHF